MSKHYEVHHFMSRFRWWHSIRKHRLRCDIDLERMVTICDCGNVWVYLP